MARLGLYFKPRDVSMRIGIDSLKRDEFIDRIAGDVDRPAVNAGLEFKSGQVLVVEGQEGLVMDRPAMATALDQKLLALAAGEIEIPMIVSAPHIQAADATEAVETARTMISREVTLRGGDKTWPFSVSMIESSLDYRTEGEGESSKLVPFISAEKLVTQVAAVAESVKTAPKNATWETDGQKATLVPAVPGKELDATTTALAVDTAAKSRTNRVAEIALKDIPAERTTEKAEAMGVKDKLGEFSVGVYGSSNRQENLRRATQLINNTLVAPGDEFSFNRVVGKRTAENGFNTAPVIMPDGRLEDALGGGVCQVATVLFNAAFFSGLKITERSNHMLYISTYPMGRDAAVDYGSQDVRFVNDTGKWLLIKGAVGDSVKFVIYGTSDGRKVSYTTSDWYGVTAFSTTKVINPELKPGEVKVKNAGQTGRSCTVKRTVTRGGQTLHSDTFYSVFPAITRVEEIPDPKATTTTTAPTTTTGSGTTTTLQPPTTTTTTGPPPPTTTTTVSSGE
jgi:vancomycin resistance protein YoaR